MINLAVSCKAKWYVTCVSKSLETSELQDTLYDFLLESVQSIRTRGNVRGTAVGEYYDK